MYLTYIITLFDFCYSIKAQFFKQLLGLVYTEMILVVKFLNLNLHKFIIVRELKRLALKSGSIVDKFQNAGFMFPYVDASLVIFYFYFVPQKKTCSDSIYKNHKCYVQVGKMCI